MGRTGKWFGYQHYSVEPDILTLAKALGGGVPIGAMMAKAEIAASFVAGTHGSTFGGNPLATEAGVAVIKAIEEEGLLENAQQMSQHIRQRLEELAGKHSIIEKIKGIGLMIGIALNGPGADVVSKCLSKGLRINCTQTRILRFMPGMNINKDEADKALNILDNVLSEMG